MCTCDLNFLPSACLESEQYGASLEVCKINHWSTLGCMLVIIKDLLGRALVDAADVSSGTVLV